MGFEVDIIALGQDFDPSTLSFPYQHHATNAPFSFIYLSPTLYYHSLAFMASTGTTLIFKPRTSTSLWCPSQSLCCFLFLTAVQPHCSKSDHWRYCLIKHFLIFVNFLPPSLTKHTCELYFTPYSLNIPFTVYKICSFMSGVYANKLLSRTVQLRLPLSVILVFVYFIFPCRLCWFSII